MPPQPPAQTRGQQTPPPVAATTAAETPKPPDGYKQSDNAPVVLVESVTALLDVAKDLDVEKDDLQNRIGANRSMLRGYVTQKIATPEQAGLIETFYPTRTRGKNGNA